MEINAKCKFDYASVIALSRASTYRRFNPKITTIIMIVFSIIDLSFEVMAWSYDGIEAVSVPTLIISLTILGVAIYMYWLFPKMQYNGLGKMKNIENRYVFEDEVLKVSSISEGYNGMGELMYSLISKVVETSSYLFVYQDKKHAFIIDKSTILNGTIDEIRAKLIQFVNKKYITYRY